MSSNLVVSGLTIQNSPQFHMKFDGCDGVLIEKLSISSPKLSPNTDGIHIENTKDVGIYNSVISNGKLKKKKVVSLQKKKRKFIVNSNYFFLFRSFGVEG